MRKKYAVGCWMGPACLTALLVLLPEAGALDADVSPACWDAPRMLHLGAASTELVERVRLMRVPGDEGDEMTIHNPEMSRPGPWRAVLNIPLNREETLRVLLDDVSGPIAVREFGPDRVIVRVPWGRTTFSDLLIDRRDGELIHHEQLVDGTDAWRQARESCGLPEMDGDAACDCASPVGSSIRPRAQPGADSIIGLLVLPELFGPGETGGVVAADPVKPLPLYAAPDATRAPARWIEDASELEWREYAYEAGAAIVIGQQENWYRIRLADGRNGWVQGESTARFLPLSALYASAMTYLTPDWSGRLWRHEAGAWRVVEIEHRDETHAEVVAIETQDDALWLEVRIDQTSPCESGDSTTLARGWVPAWNSQGELNVWFYSRGC